MPIIRFLHRGILAGAIAVATVCTPAGAAAAIADEGDPLVVTSGQGGLPPVLSPGLSSVWDIGVTTRNVTLDTLGLSLWADGPLADLSNSVGPEQAVTVEVKACRSPWSGGRCDQGGWTVIPSMALGDLRGQSATLAAPDGTLPAGVHLQVIASLSEAAGDEVKGLSSAVTGRVDASGELVGAAPGTAPGPGSGLADTGLWVIGFASLGLVAVFLGLLVSRLSRPLPSPHRDDSGRRSMDGWVG